MNFTTTTRKLLRAGILIAGLAPIGATLHAEPSNRADFDRAGGHAILPHLRQDGSGQLDPLDQSAHIHDAVGRVLLAAVVDEARHARRKAVHRRFADFLNPPAY